MTNLNSSSHFSSHKYCKISISHGTTATACRGAPRPIRFINKVKKMDNNDKITELIMTDGVTDAYNPEYDAGGAPRKPSARNFSARIGKLSHQPRETPPSGRVVSLFLKKP